MYDNYYRNYGMEPTYQGEYDEYLDTNNFENMQNEYSRFMPRPVNSFPYVSNAMYNNFSDTEEAIKMYPEIYNKILPIIEKKLDHNIVNMDNDVLEKLTFEVYDEFISSDIGKKLNIQVASVNTGCITSATQESKLKTDTKAVNNSNFNSSRISTQGMNKYAQSSSSSNSTQNSSNKKLRNNCLLCDLIKIMILKKWRENQRPSRPEPRFPTMNNSRSQIPWSQNIRPNRYGFSESNMTNYGVSYRPNYFDVPYPEDFGY